MAVTPTDTVPVPSPASVKVTVAVPAATAVMVNVVAPDPGLTVATLVSLELAENVPLYPCSVTVTVWVCPTAVKEILLGEGTGADAPVTVTPKLDFKPLASVTEIVALPVPTAITVNVPELVALSALRADATRDAGASPATTVATATFEDVAVNVPEYPSSVTVKVAVAPAPVSVSDDAPPGSEIIGGSNATSG